MAGRLSAKRSGCGHYSCVAENAMNSKARYEAKYRQISECMMTMHSTLVPKNIGHDICSRMNRCDRAGENGDMSECGGRIIVKDNRIRTGGTRSERKVGRQDGGL